MNILTHFSEVNICRMPDFFMLLGTKKKEYETQFWEGFVKFTKYKKKNKHKRKRQNYFCSMKNWKNWTILIVNSMASHLYNLLQLFPKVLAEICGDLGINNKTPNRMLTRRLPHTKYINASPRIRLHASIRLKIRKKRKIIKSKVANGKRSCQN